MNELRLGDISLRDYLKVIEPRGKRRAKKLGLGAAAVVMCVLCTAAGDYLGPWTGKNSKDVTFDEARAILEHPLSEEWATEIGLNASFRHIRSAMDQMRDAALNGRADAGYASDYLRNVSIAGIAHIIQLRDADDPGGRHTANLKFIRDKLPPD